VYQQGDARSADHHLPENREGGLPRATDLSAQQIQGDVAVPLNPQGHPEENQPDEGPAGHLFRPTQGCIEGIAKKDLGQRDRNRGQKKDGADRLQGAVKPAQTFSNPARQ
jgi:hypothetical protein